MIEMDCEILFQLFLKWLKTCSANVLAVQRADRVSNLGQRGKDAEQWHSSECLTGICDAHLLMTPEMIWFMTMMMVVRIKMTLQSSDTKADPRFQRKPHLLCQFKTKQTGGLGEGLSHWSFLETAKVQKSGRHEVVPGFRALYDIIKGFQEMCWSTRWLSERDKR